MRFVKILFLLLLINNIFGFNEININNNNDSGKDNDAQFAEKPKNQVKYFFSFRFFLILITP